MIQFFRLLLILLWISTTIHAYESENRLKTVIVGKVAKYISWNKNIDKQFIITVLKNRYGNLFTNTYLNKKIKSKPVKIKYISNIYELEDSEILFISKSNNNLKEILEYVKHKNILTVSDKLGFAQKGGIIQLYFVGQMLKLKINIDIMREENLKADRALLRIVDIVKRRDN